MQCLGLGIQISVRFLRLGLWGILLCGIFAGGEIQARVSEDKTPENAMKRIVNVLNVDQLKELERRVAFDVADWPPGSTRFVRVDRDDMPILGDHSFTSPSLDISGLTKSGEILELIREAEVIEIPNPLGWQGVGNGLWYHVRLLNNKDGWVFAGQRNCSSPFATSFQRPRNSQDNTSGITKAEATLPGWVKFVIGIVVVALFCLVVGASSKRSSGTISNSHHGDSSGYSGGYSGGGSSSDSSRTAPQAEWPWSDDKVVVGHKNVYTEGFFGNSKVGHVEEHVLSDDSIHKDGFISSERVGNVERNFWGTPTAINDNNGNKVGDIKQTFWGDKIIVDEKGNKLGEYKGE